MKPFTRILTQTLAVALLFTAHSCKKEDDEYSLNNAEGISINSIISFKEIDSLSVEADGTTTNRISIQINPEADLSDREVRLTTTVGKFSNGGQTDTVTPNASGVVSFIISSELPGMGNISASIKSFQIDTVINFRPSLPHEILLSADPLIADTTDTVTLTVDLVRNPFKGKVSDPVKVFFGITPLTSQSASLIIAPFGLSSQGKVNLTITNPFFLKGDFKAEAKTVSATGDTLRREINFRIQ